MRRLARELKDKNQRIRRYQFIPLALETFNTICRGFDARGPAREHDSKLWCVDLKQTIESVFGTFGLSEDEKVPTFDLRTHVLPWHLLRALQRCFFSVNLLTSKGSTASSYSHF